MLGSYLNMFAEKRCKWFHARCVDIIENKSH